MTQQMDVFAALAHVEEFPYVWFWRQKLTWGPSRKGGRGTPPRVFDRERKGERCRVLARGTMNSGLIEFVDGYRVVTSRGGLRRADGSRRQRRAAARVRRDAAEARS